jgi:hypothetical protein
MANNLVIESHLKDSLTEHMMAEISQGSIVDIETAVEWMKYTFMYIRMKNLKKKGDINKQLHEICETIFTKLKDITLIAIEGNSIVTNPLGKKMSKHFIHFETIKNIFNIKDNSEEYILETLSNSHEFAKYRSKLEERKFLNDFNKDCGIKYKVKGCIDTPNKKAFILLQATLANLTVEHWEMRRQQTEILATSLRVLNCFKEMYKQKNDAKGLIQCVILKKCLNQRMWIDTELISRQLPKIGDKLAKNLAKGGINNFEKISKENPRRLETICGKNAPFGNVLVELVNSIPILKLNFELNKNYKSYVKLVLNISLPYKKLINQEDFDPYTTYHLIIGEREGKLLYQKKVRPSTQDKTLYFSVNLDKNSFPVCIHCISDKFIGLDKMISIANADDNEGSIINRPIQKNLLSYNTTAIDNSLLSSNKDGELGGSPVKKKRQRKKKDSNDNGNISDLLKNMKKGVTKMSESRETNTSSKVKEVNDFKLNHFDNDVKISDIFDNTERKPFTLNNIVINNNNNILVNNTQNNQFKTSLLSKLNSLFN